MYHNKGTKIYLCTMKRIFFTLTAILLLSSTGLKAQSIEYYKDVIRELSSKKYEGRSDYGGGDLKAARFIAEEYKKIDALQPSMPNGYFQPFTYPVNVFHKKMEMAVDGVALDPGHDFIAREFSPSLKGTFPLVYIKKEDHHPDRLLPMLATGAYKNSFVVVDYDLIYEYMGIAPEPLYHTPIAGLIMVQKKNPSFFKSRSATRQPIPVVWASPRFPQNAKEVTVRFQAKWIKKHTANNVVAHIPGTTRADSCIVFVAHYDHLGHFGKDVFFPGANDNASGVAFMLTLAEYYAKPENRPDLTYFFLAVAAEENNLLGSTFYAENPVFPLDKTLQVFSIDMVADNYSKLFLETGPEGQKNLDRFVQINDNLQLFDTLVQDPLSNDSDHYPFAVRKVPALYIMVDGDAWSVYHTPLDDFDHIYTNRYLPLFQLITAFVDTF